MDASKQKSELSLLIQKIRDLNLSEVDMAELCRPCPAITWQDFLPEFSKINTGDGSYFILDVRSESEFAESAIPSAVNFPIFDDNERHNVGLLFKQQSEKLAEQIGSYYALQKKDAYLESVRRVAGDKKILVHCWRGGYRSKAVTALLNRNGFEAYRLDGGHKGFRRAVHKFLYERPPRLISLSGITGTGKSVLLESIIKDHPEIPVLHLEEAALHASSVFGAARFGWQEITNQQEFETRLYLQILPWIKDGKVPVFITEKESSQIGKVIIPNGILDELKKEEHIRLKSSMATRVQRLKKEYIDGANKTTLEQLRTHITYLKRLLGDDTLNEYLTLFDQKKWELLLENILKDYYDKVYKKCQREPIAEVLHEDTKTAVAEVINLYKKQILE
jgi:tRNA 2-selenouridine synthase